MSRRTRFTIKALCWAGLIWGYTQAVAQAEASPGVGWTYLGWFCFAFVIFLILEFVNDQPKKAERKPEVTEYPSNRCRFAPTDDSRWCFTHNTHHQED